MGKLCSCNYITGEEKEEFNGFSGNYNDENNFINIIKKNFNKYNEKDKKYYRKTSDYDNLLENTSIHDIEITEEPIEFYNGSVKVIQWKNMT